MPPTAVGRRSRLAQIGLLPVLCGVDLSILLDLRLWQWLLVIAASLFIGMSRTVYSGLALIFIPLMAAAFGGKVSLGIILPLLCFGDVFAVSWYRRQADFRAILKLLPWTFTGMLAGLLTVKDISDGTFKRIIALIVLVCLVLMFLQDRRRSETARSYPLWVSVLSGLAAGFTTMIGNAAGPIMTVYLLSKGLGKNSFIGTTAWFFLIVNLSKLPLQAFFWKNMNAAGFTLDLALFPVVLLGAFLGLKIAGKIPEREFRIFIYVVSVFSAIFLLL